MSLRMYLACLSLSCLFACGKNAKEQEQPARQFSSNINQNDPVIQQMADINGPVRLRKPKDNENLILPQQLEKEFFQVELPGMVFSASRDSDGYATINNYPTQWEGKGRITRFDGYAEDSPFSDAHCKVIRAMNKFGGGKMARSAFRSLIKIEVPPFVSSRFDVAVADAARKSGIYGPIFSVKNSVQRWRGTQDLNFSETSISRLYGHLDDLKDQLNLAIKGNENKSGEYELIITSGDILCDLITGAATLTMHFPIQGEEKVIKVIYDKFLVTL